MTFGFVICLVLIGILLFPMFYVLLELVFYQIFQDDREWTHSDTGDSEPIPKSIAAPEMKYDFEHTKAPKAYSWR